MLPEWLTDAPNRSPFSPSDAFNSWADNELVVESANKHANATKLVISPSIFMLSLFYWK